MAELWRAQKQYLKPFSDHLFVLLYIIIPTSLLKYSVSLLKITIGSKNILLIYVGVFWCKFKEIHQKKSKSPVPFPPPPLYSLPPPCIYLLPRIIKDKEIWLWLPNDSDDFGWFLGETDFGTNFVHLAILENSDMTSISNFGWFLGETDFGTNFVHLAIL